MNCPYSRTALLAAASVVFCATASPAQVPDSLIRDEQLITFLEGGFQGWLDGKESFGWSIENIGDLDGNGVDDLAVGDPNGASTLPETGRVWILFMKNDGTVDDWQAIDGDSGGFTGTLTRDALFGFELAWMGDLGPGAPTPRALAVSAPAGNPAVRTIFTLFLNTDGTVFSHTVTRCCTGNEGHGLAWLGDLGAPGADNALAISALSTDKFGNVNAGSVRIVFLDVNALPTGEVLIESFEGGLNTIVLGGFGADIVRLNDLDNNGVDELAVGAPADTDPTSGNTRGAIWILFLNDDGTVGDYQKFIAADLSSGIEDFDGFGAELSAMDLDGNGVRDLLVGAQRDDDGGADRGAAWWFMLQSDDAPSPRYAVLSDYKWSDTRGAFDPALIDMDWFGSSMVPVGDVDGDGTEDVAVSARNYIPTVSPGCTRCGAFWVLFLQSPFDKYCPAFPGVAGTGGLVPQLDAYGASRPGGAVDLVISDAGGAVGGLFASDSPAAINQCPGFPIPPFAGNLVFLPVLSAPVAPISGGTATISLSIPSITTVGADLFWQVLILDGGAPLGVSFSEALRMTILPD